MRRDFVEGLRFALFPDADFPQPGLEAAGFPLLDLYFVFFRFEVLADDGFFRAEVFLPFEAAEVFFPASFLPTTFDSFSED